MALLDEHPLRPETHDTHAQLHNREAADCHHEVTAGSALACPIPTQGARWYAGQTAVLPLYTPKEQSASVSHICADLLPQTICAQAVSHPCCKGLCHMSVLAPRLKL
jgi:hypothetical protein